MKLHSFFYSILLLLVLSACGGGGNSSSRSESGGGTTTPISISISYIDQIIAFGANVSMTASGFYSDGSTRDLTNVVTWQSSDPEVATVDSGGVVSAVSVGETIITATLGDASDTFLIIVDSIVHLAKTGQTTSYAPNDDGSLQAGSYWPSPRFTIDECGTTTNTDDVVTDQLTGLMWVRNHGGSNPRSWQQSLDYANALSLCGYDDWRLANINELESLLLKGAENSFDWLATQGFVMSQASFWTSTTLAMYPNRAWNVNVFGGVYEYPKTTTSSAWAVRGPVPARALTLARTGQTTCYDTAGNVLPSCVATGQDGEHLAGTPWPSPRFRTDDCGTPADTTDDIIADNLTGLMWPRHANLFGAQTWTDALANASGSSICGYGDWRLPNQRELRSLIDYQQGIVGNWLMQQGFENVQAANVMSCYWTSTSGPLDSANQAVCGFLFNGVFADTIAKTATHYVWPVRRGEGGQIF